MDGDAMNRVQARQVWALRLALPEEARSRFDALPISTQAQLAEIYAEVWSDRDQLRPGRTRRLKRGAGHWLYLARSPMVGTG